MVKSSLTGPSQTLHSDHSIVTAESSQIASNNAAAAAATHLELQALYKASFVKAFRQHKIKLLRKPPWQTLDEGILDQELWPGASEEARCEGGVWITDYPPGSKLAVIIISTEWRAFEGDPTDPLIEWEINVPDSAYYPGTHSGVIYVKDMRSGLWGCKTRVGWRSPIYSPLVREEERGNGSLSSDGPLEEPAVDYTELLYSIAHTLAFGPFGYRTDKVFPPFGFHYEGAEVKSHYKIEEETGQDAFRRASSFFSRAYNLEIPDESAFTGQELHQQARDTSIAVITELLRSYRPELLEDTHDGDWNFRDAFAKVTTQRNWAMEERKWADKIIEACNLRYLKHSREQQLQQEQSREQESQQERPTKELAIRTLERSPAIEHQQSSASDPSTQASQEKSTDSSSREKKIENTPATEKVLKDPIPASDPNGDLTKGPPSDWTILHRAVWNQNISHLPDLIRTNKFLLNRTDKHGYTALHLACSAEDSMLFGSRQIYDRGLHRYNIVDDYAGLLRLRRAWAPHRHRSFIDSNEQAISAAAVELLLAAGADCTIKSHHCFTAMHCAANSGWLKVVKLLVEAGAPVYTGPECSPLCWADSLGLEDPGVRAYLQEKLGPDGMQKIMDDHERDAREAKQKLASRESK